MADTALETIKEMVSKNRYISNDSYEYVFFNRTARTNKYQAFLSPDSKLYSCPLNPLFSFELESGKKFMLKSFELLSLRDGVLPLLYFFYQHPSPEKIDPVIVIDHRLSALVPMAWREKVVLRQLYSHSVGQSKAQKKLMIYLAADSLCAPLSLVKRELDKITQLIDRDWEVNLFFSSLNKKGEEDCQFDDAHKLSVLQLCLEQLAGFQVKIVNWMQWQACDLSGCAFAFINPLLFYCSDSYLEHASLQRGARPLLQETQSASGYYHKLSLFHGFILHQQFDQALKEDKILLDFLNKHLTSIQADQDDYQKIKLAPIEIEQWALSLAQSLYHQREKTP